MKMLRFNQFLLLFATMVLFSCGKATETTDVSAVEASQPDTTSVNDVSSYGIGDHVPSDLVCMVNNAYMGEKQMEVLFETKVYYGCCEMCVERIPNDKEARTAIDPFTSKPIDKSEAYIVLTSGRGDVAYFETEQTYRQFLAAE